MTNEIHNISNNAYINQYCDYCGVVLLGKAGITNQNIFTTMLSLQTTLCSTNGFGMGTCYSEQTVCENGARSVYMQRQYDTWHLGILFLFFFFFFAFCLFLLLFFFTLEKEMELIETQPGFEPGSSEFGQMLLLSEPLELWYWSRK